MRRDWLQAVGIIVGVLTVGWAASSRWTVRIQIAREPRRQARGSDSDVPEVVTASIPHARVSEVVELDAEQSCMAVFIGEGDWAALSDDGVSTSQCEDPVCVVVPQDASQLITLFEQWRIDGEVVQLDAEFRRDDDALVLQRATMSTDDVKVTVRSPTQT